MDFWHSPRLGHQTVIPTNHVLAVYLQYDWFQFQLAAAGNVCELSEAFFILIIIRLGRLSK